MKYRVTALFLSAFVLSGCGSASDAVTFQAPPGYKAEASMGPFAQVWKGPNDSTLVLMAIPTKIDLSKRLNQSPVNDGGQVTSDRQITICGDQPARLGTIQGATFEFSTATSPASHKTAVNTEFLATIVNGKTYMVLYARRLGEPADPQAEAALHNVCPKPS